MKPGEFVKLNDEVNLKDLIVADEIGPISGGKNKFSSFDIGAVLETKTFVKVIAGTNIGWIEEKYLKST